MFFRQTRIGAQGRPFGMVKFRSMVTNAEAQLADLAEESDGNGILFKMKDDPRVTKVGKFIRRFSLDELPQLINVVRGEMSLIGPRPPLPSEVAEYESDAVRRLHVRPGMTGAVAGEWSFGPVVGGVLAPRPVVCRQLDPDPRPADPRRDLQGRSAGVGRVLEPGAAPSAGPTRTGRSVEAAMAQQSGPLPQTSTPSRRTRHTGVHRDADGWGPVLSVPR